MCLAVPGRVIAITENSDWDRPGEVNFNGVLKTVQLAYVPECREGDYVLVHAGFAISVLDAEEANDVLNTFAEWSES